GFAVNGSSIPEVGFDVGESYAGLLPINSSNAASGELFFWLFPSTNPTAIQNKEIIIWLSGGPGCSSLAEFLQFNGPISWKPGTFQPISNKFSWHRLSNVVWIDQPLGTGYSSGTPTARNEADVASQFLSFWSGFSSTFGIDPAWKIYLAGSSYSGMYIPYISSALLRSPTLNASLSGVLLLSPLLNNPALYTSIPAAHFAHANPWALPFNASFSSAIRSASSECNYTSYLSRYLTFPPNLATAGGGPQPSNIPLLPSNASCALSQTILAAARSLNPCFTPYDVSVSCPLPLDPLGFSYGNFALFPSGPPYFDRADVKSLLHVPAATNWSCCAPPAKPVFAGPAGGLDETLLSGQGSFPVLAQVIERTGNVIVGTGARDFQLVAEGTLLTIQNLTWNGATGFQNRPTGGLYLPSSSSSSNISSSSSSSSKGIVGTVHTERGLTWFGSAMAGHFIGRDQPALAFRAVEVLLGRVSGLGSTQGWSVAPLGGGGGNETAGEVSLDGTVIVEEGVGLRVGNEVVGGQGQGGNANSGTENSSTDAAAATGGVDRKRVDVGLIGLLGFIAMIFVLVL
ncbi:hypothetical protein QBC42DRAFT_329219, partial [Cladorrhinum samala]